MLLPVDDDGCDLLVHEDEDGAEQRGDKSDDGGPPGVGPHGVNNPATIIPGWLRRERDMRKMVEIIHTCERLTNKCWISWQLSVLYSLFIHSTDRLTGHKAQFKMLPKGFR